MSKRKHFTEEEIKAAKRLADKKYYENNKEKIKEYKFNYYSNNKKTILGKSKVYYKTNKEEKIKYQKEYRINNPEKVKEIKNRAKKKNRENNPHIIAWRVFLKNSLKRLNKIKEGHTIDLLGYSALELKNHISSLFT